MKRLAVIACCVVLSVSGVSCRPENENGDMSADANKPTEPPAANEPSGQEQPISDAEHAWINGTVKYIEVEGGFYGIITQDGTQLDPVNLPEEFQEDGLEVKFLMKEAEEQLSFHMWGELVDIVKIRRR